MPAPAYNYDLKAMRAAVNEKTRIVFLANPNNPTGSDLTAKEIIDFADSLPETCVLVMDEAYTEFIEDTPELVPDFNSRIAEGRRSRRPPRGLLHHPPRNREPHQPRA